MQIRLQFRRLHDSFMITNKGNSKI